MKAKRSDVVMKSTRAEVYEALDGERAYQEMRWNADTTESEGRHVVAEWVLYMEHYLNLAKVALSTKPEPAAQDEALHIIRKVTALGVVCMEQNGAPKREGF